MLAVLGTCAAATAVGWLPKHQIGEYDAAFRTVASGMDEAQLRQAMGAPDDIVRGGFLPFWDDEPLPDDAGGRFRLEYRYKVRTFFLPITWMVGFDERGRVISKHRQD